MGEKALRKHLAVRAALLSMEEKHAREMIMWMMSRRTDVKTLSKTSGDHLRYLSHVSIGLKLTKYDLNLFEMFLLFVRHIPAHLDAKEDGGGLMDACSRVELTEALEDVNTFERVPKNPGILTPYASKTTNKWP